MHVKTDGFTLSSIEGNIYCPINRMRESIKYQTLPDPICKKEMAENLQHQWNV